MTMHSKLALAMFVVLASPIAMTQTRQVHPLDQSPPKMPDGTAVPTSIGAGGGDAMCWGDPSQDGRVITGEFGEMRGHKSSPHAGVDMRARAGSPIYAVADGCVSFGNPTPRQLIGVKQRINDRFPNSSIWYLHMSRVEPKFINDGRSGQCVPVRKGDLIGYSGNFYGTGGKEVSSGHAHLHLSYFASGVQINPAPYQGAPAEIPAEYNTIKSVNEIASEVSSGGRSMSDNDASGTRGSKLGFGVPRMCNVYTVKATGKETIPYNGNFGTGNYSANATAPSQAALDDGQQRVRQALGVGVDGKGSGRIDDPAHWTGGLPEEPDWESYAQMSPNQIIQAEVARRMSDPRWAEQLTEQSSRGAMMELAWMKGLILKLRERRAESQQRTEAMYSAMLAARMRQLAISADAALSANQQPGVR
ncbi:M23 family metallopeptidase [Paracidovorax wautersii]|uniref:Peptidase family M23 n=1 Tax=Paracidovorax wautersii TaxID=1177982 RepID=A0A1I2HQH9_9BURK|nr:M23 family metallopeptidase [Paracidovorax wautersii]SFF31590.1 Peptidase family M23 [Paracidovorax wautersii]